MLTLDRQGAGQGAVRQGLDAGSFRGSVCDKDVAPAAYMDVFTAVPRDLPASVDTSSRSACQLADQETCRRLRPALQS